MPGREGHERGIYFPPVASADSVVVVEEVVAYAARGGGRPADMIEVWAQAADDPFNEDLEDVGCAEGEG